MSERSLCDSQTEVHYSDTDRQPSESDLHRNMMVHLIELRNED